MSATTRGLAERGNSTRKAGAERGGNGPLERITVNLTQRSAKALEMATGLTGDTKTDTINRALQVYAYLEHVTANGGSVYTQESPDSERTLLKYF